jgi:hypothetical protein
VVEWPSKPLPPPNSPELLAEVTAWFAQPAQAARLKLALCYAIPHDLEHDERWVQGSIATALFIADNVHRDGPHG